MARGDGGFPLSLLYARNLSPLSCLLFHQMHIISLFDISPLTFVSRTSTTKSKHIFLIAPNQRGWSNTQTCRFWIGPSLRLTQWTVHLRGCHIVVSRPGTTPWCLPLLGSSRRMECRMHLCRNGHRIAIVSW